MVNYLLERNNKIIVPTYIYSYYSHALYPFVWIYISIWYHCPSPWMSFNLSFSVGLSVGFEFCWILKVSLDLSSFEPSLLDWRWPPSHYVLSLYPISLFLKKDISTSYRIIDDKVFSPVFRDVALLSSHSHSFHWEICHNPYLCYSIYDLSFMPPLKIFLFLPLVLWNLIILV